MKKASLKLSVGVLSLVAAGAVSGEAAARIATDAGEDNAVLDMHVRGVRFFSDPDEGLNAPVPPALPAIAVAPRTTIAPEITSGPAPETDSASIAAPPQAVARAKVKPSAPDTGPEEVIAAGVARPVADIATDAATQAQTTQAQTTQASAVSPPVILTPEQSLQAERDRLNNRPTEASTTKAKEPLEDDGLGEDGAFITADEVTSPEENVVVARGAVEMRWEGRLIRADQIWYDQTTGRTVATGNVQSVNPDGSIQYADRLEVDNDHTSGTGERIAFIDADKSKLFANKVERLDENASRLSEVIFTPCELCVKNNVTQEPTWHIQASTITQDKKRRMVIYRNAVFKAKGIPVFYLPVLWHADPSVKRSSGFLMPKPGFSKRRGFKIDIPYLWAVSPSTDVIITPVLSTKVNPFLNLEVNRRFYSGDFHSRIGVTSEKFFDNQGDKWGETQTRGYALLDGSFDINEDWRWNFTLQRAWDKAGDGLGVTGLDAGTPLANLFERYKIDDAFPKTGEFTPGSRQLISQANLIRQTDTSFVSLSLISFQNLTIAGAYYLDPANPTTSPILYTSPLDRTQPSVAPMFDAYWSPDHEILGGRVTLSANAVSILRKSTPSTDIYPGSPDLYSSTYDYRGPVDTARANLGLSWRRDIITPVGLKVAPFLEARHDEYYLRDYYNESSAYVPEDDTRRVSRSLGTVGIDLSYPLIRKFEGFNLVVEPIVQVAASPDSKLYPYLTNEDSNAFEFNSTSLFKANKSPGFDLYEGGKRLNTGLKTQLNFDSGLRIATLVGRSFRKEPEESFYRNYTVNGVTYTYDASGLAGKKSDWIVQADFDTGKGLRGYTRQRIDDDGSIRRGETGMSYVNASSQFTLRHQYDKTAVTGYKTNYNFVVVDGELVPTEGYNELQLFGRHYFNNRWGVSAQMSRNILRKAWLRSEASIIYMDDCARFELVYQRDETALLGDSQGKASESISIRISLATLAPSDDDFVNVR